MDQSDANALGLTRHHIMESIQGSLSRLQTSYIDIYQVNGDAESAQIHCLVV